MSTEQILFFLLKNLLFTKSVIRMKNKCTWLKQPKKFLKVYGLKKTAASKGLPPARTAQSCCCPHLSTRRAPAAPPHPASAGDPAVSGGDTTVIPLNGELGLPLKHFRFGAFLVAQWVRIHLPMQGAQAPPLIRKDPTRHTATTPLYQPPQLQSRPREPKPWSPPALEPVLCCKRYRRSERPVYPS